MHVVQWLSPKNDSYHQRNVTESRNRLIINDREYVSFMCPSKLRPYNVAISRSDMASPPFVVSCATQARGPQAYRVDSRRIIMFEMHFWPKLGLRRYQHVSQVISNSRGLVVVFQSLTNKTPSLRQNTERHRAVIRYRAA